MAGVRDDDDADEAAIAEKGARAFAEHQNRSAAAEDDAEVPVEEPGESDDEELDETPKAPDRAQQRRQRNADRISARERAAAAEARAEMLAQQLEEERRRPYQAQQQPQQGNQLEQFDRQIREVTNAQKRLHEDYTARAGRLTQREEQEFFDRAERLEIEKGTLIADRRNAMLAPQRETEARVAELRNRHPDVFANPAALRYAQGEWNKLQALGRPDNRETVDQAFQEARERVLGVRPAPDQSTRQRLSGMGSRTAGNSPSQRSAGSIQMPKGGVYDRMARAAFPKLDPAEARQKWANTVGRGILEKARG